MLGAVKVSGRKWRFKGPTQQHLVNVVGARARDMVRSRVQGRGVDAAGTPVPKLSAVSGRSRSRGKFFASEDDPRFRGILPGRSRSVDALLGGVLGKVGGKRSKPAPGEVLEPERKKMRFVAMDYGAVKRKLGKQPRKDGDLTGSMWRALTATFRATSRGAGIRLSFRGSDPNTRRGTGVFLVKSRREAKRSLAQGRKAYFLQFERGWRGGRQQFVLLQVSRAELDALRDLTVKGIRQLV